MSKKIIFYSALISMIVGYSKSSDSKPDFSSFDSICTYCSSKSTNSESKTYCQRYKTFCEFKNMIQYIGERLMAAKKVAIAKWDSNDPIVDHVREEQVLESIAKQSEDIGLDPFWAKKFFRDQIDANVYVQQRLHEVWNKTGFRPHGPTVDLVNEIRPIIDRLNRQLIDISFETRIIRGTNWCHFLRYISAKNISNSLEMSGIEREALGTALKDVCLNLVR